MHCRLQFSFWALDLLAFPNDGEHQLKFPFFWVSFAVFPNLDAAVPPTIPIAKPPTCVRVVQDIIFRASFVSGKRANPSAQTEIREIPRLPKLSRHFIIVYRYFTQQVITNPHSPTRGFSLKPPNSSSCLPVPWPIFL